VANGLSFRAYGIDLLVTLRSGSVSAKPPLRVREAEAFGLSFRAYAIAFGVL